MKKNKKGENVFDSMQECHNFIKDHYSIDNIKKRALERDRKPIPFECAETNYQAVKKSLHLLKDGHPKTVLGFITDAVAKGATRPQAICYLANEMKCRIDRIVDWEREAIDKIKDKLALVVVPYKVSDIITE